MRYRYSDNIVVRQSDPYEQTFSCVVIDECDSCEIIRNNRVAFKTEISTMKKIIEEFNKLFNEDKNETT